MCSSLQIADVAFTSYPTLHIASYNSPLFVFSYFVYCYFFLFLILGSTNFCIVGNTFRLCGQAYWIICSYFHNCTLQGFTLCLQCFYQCAITSCIFRFQYSSCFPVAPESWCIYWLRYTRSFTKVCQYKKKKKKTTRASHGVAVQIISSMSQCGICAQSIA